MQDNELGLCQCHMIDARTVVQCKTSQPGLCQCHMVNGEDRCTAQDKALPVSQDRYFAEMVTAFILFTLPTQHKCQGWLLWLRAKIVYFGVLSVSIL